MEDDNKKSADCQQVMGVVYKITNTLNSKSPNGYTLTDGGGRKKLLKMAAISDKMLAFY